MNQDKMIKILYQNLFDFYKNYDLNKIEIRKASTIHFVKKIVKHEIDYVNLKSLNLVQNLNLVGHFSYNSIIKPNDDFNEMLELEFAYNLVVRFIKNIRLRLKNDNYLMMRDGLTYNKYLSKQLCILYINDLIEYAIPNLSENQDLICCCDEDQLILFTDSKETLSRCFDSIVDNLPEYNLNMNCYKSFISTNILSTVASKLPRYGYFNNFKFDKDIPIDYRPDLFKPRNVKSTFTFYHFEEIDSFKLNLINKFMNDIKFFRLDEDIYTFEQIIYFLFTHFSIYSVQSMHFFQNTILLKYDENPKLVYELMVDVCHDIIKQLEYQDKLICNFKFSIDFYTLLYLSSGCFKITWDKTGPKRNAEIEMISLVQQWAHENCKITVKKELETYDLIDSYDNAFLNFDFCIRPKK